METAAISYRIVDFLKQYPPFNAVKDADLLALTADGRVRFFEANDYILWQGEPHKTYVFVVQQGTVSLWDESGSSTALKDVLGVGDLLGAERFNGARSCPYSAKAETDVLVYGFSEPDFESLLFQYPHAQRYVSTYSGRAPLQIGEVARDPASLFLHEALGVREVSVCPMSATIADAARSLLESGTDAAAVLDSGRRAAAIVSTSSVMAWVATGGGDARQMAASIGRAPVAVGPETTVADATLAFATSDTDVLTLTSTGTVDGAVQALVTPRDLVVAFGDQPDSIVRQIECARSTEQLRSLNQRARRFILRHLDGPLSVDWLARVAQAVDAAVLSRLCGLFGADLQRTCWCVAGAAGREESLTLLAPHVVVVAEGDLERLAAERTFQQVSEALDACGYLSRELPFDQSFHLATIDEWEHRFEGWVRNPVLTEMFRARPLFDLRAVAGKTALWDRLAAGVSQWLDPVFLRVLANDCLANLPPLTFFQDAVVEESGEQTSVFRLERSALRPIVDVGRVFGMASGVLLRGSTLKRLASARYLLSEEEGIFRDAAETFRVVLWQQGRVGLDQGTSGFELPPVLLSRNDRQILKGGFRSIARLLEFTANFTWLERV
ncbi:MAG: putative nucleotidyltransferase substrate binding domain-containing protein [Vicinamibacterales bacterium]